MDFLMISGGPAPGGVTSVKLQDSVLHVRKLITDALNDPWMRADLVFGGQMMEDGRTFKSYQLNDGDTLYVCITNTDPWLKALTSKLAPAGS